MERTPVLVLGIGNVLWADEGFGVRCVEALQDGYTFPEGVRLMDGGTQGLYLVNDVCASERVLVLDAIDFGDVPGTVRRLENQAVPHFAIAKKMSMHQTGFQDVLAAAALMDRSPSEVVLIGVQPVELEDFGGGLTPVVAAQVETVVRAAIEQLAKWGFAAAARVVPSEEPTLAPGLRRELYEGQRPSDLDACRAGDRRFFPVTDGG